MERTVLLQNSFIYDFFYNALIFLAHIGPGASVAFAVIALTVIVKLLLSPLSYKALVNQVEQKKLQPKIEAIRAEYKDNKELQAQKIMALYKESNTNPLSGCFLILIQIPIILGLYAVFMAGLSIQPEVLYSFIPAPDILNFNFLGIDITQRSIIFAIVAAGTQLIQVWYSPAFQTTPKQEGVVATPPAGMAAMGEQMQKSMRYTLPIMIGVFAYLVPAAVALYWIVNNIFTIIQERIVTNTLKKQENHA